MARNNRNNSPAPANPALTAEAVAAGDTTATTTGLPGSKQAEAEPVAAEQRADAAAADQAPETNTTESESAGPVGGDSLPPTGDEPEGGWCYQVTEPFKFKGTVIKPGVWIQLSDDEAAQYVAAAVIDPDHQAWPPQDA
jgi:hypothetical protein